MVLPQGVHPVGSDRCVMACIHHYAVRVLSLPYRVSIHFAGEHLGSLQFFIYFMSECSREHLVSVLVMVCLIPVGCPWRSGITGHGVCTAQVTRYCQIRSQGTCIRWHCHHQFGCSGCPSSSPALCIVCLSLFSPLVDKQ